MSIAQYLIDLYGDNALALYWSDKNNELNINPWDINRDSNRHSVWIKCQEKDYHSSYQVRCNDFKSKNSRCPYCNGKKVHVLDSLGKVLEKNELLNIWSDKNKLSPYEFTLGSQKKVWWKCPNGKHEDYIRMVSSSNNYSFRCPSCKNYKGEEKIINYLKSNIIFYKHQKKFKGLIGIGGRNLSYDFYLPQHNLLIEYQGDFHDGSANIQTEEGFKIQQEHDKRKRKYAKNNNINLLEIWYYDFDRIEEILDKQIKYYIRYEFDRKEVKDIASST